MPAATEVAGPQAVGTPWHSAALGHHLVAMWVGLETRIPPHPPSPRAAPVSLSPFCRGI